MFAVFADNNLHHIWQTSANNGWSNWESIGLGNLAPVQPAVGRNIDGRLEVFVTRNEHTIITDIRKSISEEVVLSRSLTANAILSYPILDSCERCTISLRTLLFYYSVILSFKN